MAFEDGIVVFVGGSGSGKSTTARCLIEDAGAAWLTSLTTRGPDTRDQPNEYLNLSHLQMNVLEKIDWLLWKTPVHDHYYSLAKPKIDLSLHCGGLWVVCLTPHNIPRLIEYTDGRVVPIFLESPNQEELTIRLKERNYSEEELTQRLRDGAEWEVMYDQYFPRGYKIPPMNTPQVTLAAVLEILSNHPSVS